MEKVANNLFRNPPEAFLVDIPAFIASICIIVTRLSSNGIKHTHSQNWEDLDKYALPLRGISYKVLAKLRNYQCRSIRI